MFSKISKKNSNNSKRIFRLILVTSLLKDHVNSYKTVVFYHKTGCIYTFYTSAMWFKFKRSNWHVHIMVCSSWNIRYLIIFLFEFNLPIREKKVYWVLSSKRNYLIVVLKLWYPNLKVATFAIMQHILPGKITMRMI